MASAEAPVQRKVAKAGIMLVGKPGSDADRASSALSPALHIFVTSATGILGASRCTRLGAASPEVAEGVKMGSAAHAPLAGQGSGPLGDAEMKRRLGSMLLRALGAPSFRLDSAHSAEDEVYMLLGEKAFAGWVPDILAARSEVTDHKAVHGMITSLQPRCNVAGPVLPTIFGPQVERSKTLYLNPRPLDYAIIHSSARLTGMLMRAAARSGSLDPMLGKAQPAEATAALSPLFLAVLFAGQDVVGILKSAGAVPNNVDVQAAMRLQRAGLWDAFSGRTEALGLSDWAGQLGAGVGEAKQKIADSRAALKAALLSA